MKKITKKYVIPKATRRMILGTYGASAQIRRRAACSKSLMSMILSGKRSCPEKVWEAIIDWLMAAQKSALAEMAWREIGRIQAGSQDGNSRAR